MLVALHKMHALPLLNIPMLPPGQDQCVMVLGQLLSSYFQTMRLQR